MFAIIDRDTRIIKIETESRIFCLFEYEDEALMYLETISDGCEDNIVVAETEVTFKRVE